MNKKTNLFTSFFKYNTVALIATGVDFSVFILFNDLLNLWYVFSTFISAVTGGATAFILNRNWVFQSKEKKVKTQIYRYILVWGGSIFLNTVGLYLLVENSTISELISKVIVTVLVGITYNYTMSQFYIFK